VWTEFGAIAASLGADAANLGQGYPDWAPPSFAIEAARAVCDETRAPLHQYARSAGLPALCDVLARRYSQHFGRDVDSVSEIAVCVGATQALLVSLMASIQNPGDRVVVLEPCFDLYFGQIRLAGGVPVTCPMRFAEDSSFSVDFDALRRCLAEGARVLIVNSPQNPTGKVFSGAELRHIADLVAEENRLRQKERRQSVVVISDEVYKYIVLDNDASHEHFARFLPDSTLTVSSAGKTFSATGWQIGWIVGPSPLVSHAHRLLPYLQFCASTPMQAALAVALDRAEDPYRGFSSYYHWLRDEYTRKRLLLVQALSEAGLRPLRTAGGFFVLADVQDYASLVPSKHFAGDVSLDWAFCRWLALDFGVVAIPASPFFGPPKKAPPSYPRGRIDADDDDALLLDLDEDSAEEGALALSSRLVRFAFCKSDAVLHDAAARLRSLPLASSSSSGAVTSSSSQEEEEALATSE